MGLPKTSFLKKDKISNSVVREWFIVAMVDSAGLQFIVMCNGGFFVQKRLTMICGAVLESSAKKGHHLS